MSRCSSALFTVAIAALLACSGGGGGRGAGGPPLPEIAAFGANPSVIGQGGKSTLSWTVDSGTALTLRIDPGGTDVTGKTSLEVSPEATTQYTLSATNDGGTRTAIAVVQVSTACGVSSYAFPAGPSFQIPGTTTVSSLSRTIPWKPGVPPADLVHRTAICANLSPGGGDDGAAITAAISACGEGQVVQLGPGTYKLKTGIGFRKSHVTLRGTGGPGAAQAQQARLIADPMLYGAIVALGATEVVAVGANSSLEADLAAPALQGASALQLAAGTASRFKPGDLAILDQETSPADEAMFAPWSGVDVTQPVPDFADRVRRTYALWPLALEAGGGLGVAFPWAMFDADMPPGYGTRINDRRFNRPISEMVEITAVDAATDTLTLRSPLHFTFAPGLKAKLGRTVGLATEGNGLEDLYIGSEPPGPGNNNRSGVFLNGTRRSWIRNVEMDHLGALIVSAYQCTLRDSYIHEVHGLPSDGGGGYGIYVRVGSADNLVENNVVWNYDKVMVAPGSGPGNVYAYNYMDDGWLFYQPNFVESGMEASHSSTPIYGLFEGNLTFSLGTDATHGNNILMTWLRNLATIHRGAWPPLNSYRLAAGPDGKPVQSTCVPPPGYSDKCVAYSDWGNRVGVQALFGDYFFSYVGNVLGSDDTPLDPQTGSGRFVYEKDLGYSTNVPIWDVGRFIADGLEPAFDQNVMTTLWRDGNYDIVSGATRWQGAKQAIPSSLYLCSKPVFFGGWQWPWVDGSAPAGSQYVRRPYRYYPLMRGLGTFVTPDLDPSAQPTTQYQGYQLPAFARFLKLHEIEGKIADCAASTVTSFTPECQLLLTGTVPQ